MELRRGFRSRYLCNGIDFLLMQQDEPNRITFDRSEKNGRVRAIGFRDREISAGEHVLELLRNQFNDGRLGPRVAVDKGLIARSTRHDGAEQSVFAPEADDFR